MLKLKSAINTVGLANLAALYLLIMAMYVVAPAQFYVLHFSIKCVFSNLWKVDVFAPNGDSGKKMMTEPINVEQ